MTDQIGRVLSGRYRLIAPVGSGASALVYLADDTRLRRRVAVKLLHQALAEDEAFLRRFRAEAQAAAALNHPHVLAVYDWGDDEREPYLITEYLGGGSLRAMLDAGTRLTHSQALMVGLEAARGLEYAHTRGFVHRDIKPANLLFGEDGRLRIADFGLARALSEAGWTEPGDGLVGTARYAAPEQARGGRIDGKADVYALGLVLSEAVTGVVPLTSDGALETMMARIDTPVPVPDELGVLKPILERVGRPDPADRPDAAELGRALVAAAREMERPSPLPLPGIDLGASDDVHAFPEAGFEADDITVFGRNDETGVLPRVAAPARGRRWPWLVLVALVAAAVGVAGVAIWKQLQVPSAGVPGVVTLTRDAARERIQRADASATDVAWTIKELPRFDDHVPAGIVVAQRPEPGKGLDDGGTVTLFVSQGAHPVDLPAMDGASERAARDAIAAAGFTVGKVEPRADEVVAAGTVITWSAGGKERPAQAPKGSAVDLVVSSGPAPRPIPDLSGVPEADARAELEKLQLVVVRTEGFSDTVEAGKVISTNPPKGGTAPRGGNVTMVVSKGPDLVVVPTVLGRTYDEALTMLEQAGLQGGDVSGQGNRVRQTDPVPGAKVKRGSSVNIKLGH